MEGLFPRRNTEAYFCDYTSGELKCELAAGGFYMANGITRNTDYSQIYINDPMGKALDIYDRDKDTNKLTFVQEIPYPDLIDNVKFDDKTGKIYGGGVSNMLGGLSYTGGDANDPNWTGSTIEFDYKKQDGTYKLRKLVNSGKLNGVSNGMRMHNVLVMGTFGPPGAMVCPIDESTPYENWVQTLEYRGVYTAFLIGLEKMFGIKAY